VSRLVWAAQSVVRAGNYHVGVRAGTVAVKEAVDTALGSHIVDDPRARASFAIQETSSGLEGARPVYRVYHDCTQILSTPSLHRAIAMLAARLEELLPQLPLQPGTLELAAGALVSGRAALLLAPGSLVQLLPEIERRVHRFGIRVFEGTTVRIAVKSAGLIIPPRKLLEGGPLDPRAGSSHDTAIAPGEVPVAAWLVWPVPDGHSTTRANAIARAMPDVLRPREPVDALPLLAKLIAQLEVAEGAGHAEVAAIARRVAGLPS
jgi:hypothetical protein